MWKFDREQRIARLTKHGVHPQYPDPETGTEEAKIFAKGFMNGSIRTAKEAFDIIATLRTEVFELEDALVSTDPNHPMLEIIKSRRQREILKLNEK